MLRLPKFELATPERIEDAVALLARHGERAQVLAGGTDLVPNMKHELFTPDVVVSLAGIPGLAGVESASDGSLVIGAMTTLDTLASHPLVRARAPALAQAASVISGPQLRRMGTLGGNVMLDTRCQWYNQTYFWRSALGFCLKKDGTLCHVVAGGKKCVAAASNDSAPALMTLGATLEFRGPNGRRTLPIDELYRADGIYNKRVQGEILTRVRVPPQRPGHRGAYGKLRERGSIDFPLLGIAARLELALPSGNGASRSGAIEDADVCAVALQARPVRIQGAADCLRGMLPGTSDFAAAVDEVAERARKQCHPLENIPGDAEYRRAMVPVYVRRTLRAAAEGGGPVE